MVRVVVIDDSPIFLETIIGALAQLGGVEVVGSARSGAAGIAAAREQRPDLILVDLNMPALNGIETARLLRAEHPETLICIVSMQRDGVCESRLFDAGADSFTHKADLFPQLPALIERARRTASLRS